MNKHNVRLKGKALAQLNEAIHERDNNACIICGRWVDPREKFHHYPQGPDKQDRIECGVTVCGRCHDIGHFSAWVQDFKDKCKTYLTALYPDYWEGK